MFAEAKKVLHPSSRKSLKSKKRRKTSPFVRMTTFYNWINEWKKSQNKHVQDIGTANRPSSPTTDQQQAHSTIPINHNSESSSRPGVEYF